MLLSRYEDLQGKELQRHRSRLFGAYAEELGANHKITGLLLRATNSSKKMGTNSWSYPNLLGRI